MHEQFFAFSSFLHHDQLEENNTLIGEATCGKLMNLLNTLYLSTTNFQHRYDLFDACIFILSPSDGMFNKENTNFKEIDDLQPPHSLSM